MTQKLALTLHPDAIAQLHDTFEGEIFLPNDDGYDEARQVWNGMIDKYPAIIVRPLNNQAVITAIEFAKDQDFIISVRGGGHNVAGHATNDDGIVIDLCAIKHVDIDPVKKTVRAGGGSTWGEVDAVTQQYGLAVPGGVFSDTGIAGLTLGGGLGWLRNKYGLSCDNLIGAEVVTADGRVVNTSTTENPELLWGLRGGGGNFGIVTTFEYQLHPVGPNVMFTFVFHEASDEATMKRGVELYRDYSQTAPDEVSSILALGKIPPDEHFPEELHLKPFVLFGALYAGSIEDGKKAMQPLLDFSTPMLDFSGAMPYVEAQKMFDEDYPEGMRYYWKSINLTELTDEAIDRIVYHARRQPSPLNTTDLWHIGGAVSRPNEPSAFQGREAAFLLSPEGNWVEASEDEANIAWVRNMVDDMQTFSDGSRYLNFPGFQEEGDEMMRKTFGEKYARLQALKQEYDPNNVFSLNQNIKPSRD